ncbi:MAG: hypothetical protein IPN20_24445 [Haliscomenobacter sp.]|nr:hypothetical protein [Haliscomenobacter sp.]
MPTARGSAASAVVEGKLYVIGGITSTGLVKKMEMYDPETNQWTEKASMPIARAGFRAEMIQVLDYLTQAVHTCRQGLLRFPVKPAC